MHGALNAFSMPIRRLPSAATTGMHTHRRNCGAEEDQCADDDVAGIGHAGDGVEPVWGCSSRGKMQNKCVRRVSTNAPFHCTSYCLTHTWDTQLSKLSHSPIYGPAALYHSTLCGGETCICVWKLFSTQYVCQIRVLVHHSQRALGVLPPSLASSGGVMSGQLLPRTCGYTVSICSCPVAQDDSALRHGLFPR